MKTKFFTTLVLVLMGICSLQAQPGQGRRGPEFPSEQMIKELKLMNHLHNNEQYQVMQIISLIEELLK